MAAPPKRPSVGPVEAMLPKRLRGVWPFSMLVPKEDSSKDSSKAVKQLQAIEISIIEPEPGKLPWVKTAVADSIFGAVIFLNAAFIGIDMEVGTKDFNINLWLCESAFLVCFSFEIILRIRAELPIWRKFFDAWGIFDTTVTVLGIADTWIITMALSGSENPLGSFTVLRVFRLIRLVRLIRVLRMFSELVILVQTIGNSLKAVGWMTLLLAMVLYTGSIVTVLLLGQPNALKDEPDEDITEFFGSLPKALFWHFAVVTLEGWPDMALAAMRQNETIGPLWSFYFIFMIVITNFALVNLMVGIIVERILNLSVEQENELSAFVAESEAFRSTLRTLFNSSDVDDSGDITRKEVREMMEQPATRDIMSTFGINLNVPKEALYTIMDLNREGVTTFEEFFDACLRMCGSKANVHSLWVQHDICATQHELCSRLDGLDRQLTQLTTKMVKQRQQLNRRSEQHQRALQQAMPGGPHSYVLPSLDKPGIARADPDVKAVLELRGKMERFAQVQHQILLELHSLKSEQDGSGAGGAGLPGISERLTPRSLRSQTPTNMTPGTREKVPREMGGCCGTGPSRSLPPRQNASEKDLQLRQLKAEYYKAKGK